MKNDKPSTDSKDLKFGAFKGVFTPSILTILGVIMYLRFGWVVGNGGLLGAIPQTVAGPPGLDRLL